MSNSRNVAYNLTGAVLPLILAVVTIPLYISLVGSERYGVLSVAFLLLGYFGLFDLGLGRATTYRISELGDSSAQARSDVLWTAASINFGMGLLGSLALWGGAQLFFSQWFKVDETLRKEIVQCLPLLAACLPVATITGVFAGALQARSRFLEVNTISVISTSSFQLFPLAVAWLYGSDLTGLIGAALVARMLGVAALVWRARNAMGQGLRVRFEKSEAPRLLGFGGWIVSDGLLNPMLAMVDRFAIGAVSGGTGVTLYTIPYQLAQRITIFPSALLNVLFPKLPTASAEDRDRYADGATRVLLGVMTGPVLFAIFLIHPLFSMWLGPDLGNPAADLGVLILIGFWINALAWVPLVWLQGTGRPDIAVKAHLVQIPPYLTILYLGLDHFGLTGAAGALIIRNLMDLLILTFASGQRRTLAFSSFFLIVLGAAAATVLYVSNEGVEWWVAAGSLAVATAVLSWTVIPEGQKRSLMRILHRTK
jgi:O-antigen/teichoic acid export membrane protein